MPHIEHIATGGTIDSEWQPEHDTARPAAQGVVEDYLDQIQSMSGGKITYGSTELMLKDSRDISRGDREQIANEVAERKANRILVTSGTYLMPEIARGIDRHSMATHYQSFGKRIVIASSLIPIKGYEMSDGGFSLGLATAVLSEPDSSDFPPVVGAVNGNVIPANELEKDMTTATFESPDSTDLLGFERFTLVPAGGTMDFVNTTEDSIEPAQDSSIPQYLRDHVHTTKPFHATPPILKDSRDLTDGDIDTISEMIALSETEHVLVTCGLIRIKEVRDRIHKNVGSKIQDKTVVLTGSKLMLRKAGFSDAPFNLGYSFAQMGLREPGVYTSVLGEVESC